MTLYLPMLRVFRHYVPALLLAALTADSAIILAAVAISRLLTPGNATGSFWAQSAAVGGAVLLALYAAELYKTDLRIPPREGLARLLGAIFTGAVLAGALGLVVPAFRLEALSFLEVFGILGGGLLVWRGGSFPWCSPDRLRARVLVLGVSAAASRIFELQSTGSRPFKVLGFVDNALDAQDRLPEGAVLLGKSIDLLGIVDDLAPDLVLVALADMRQSFPADDLLECRLRGIRVEDWPTFHEKQTGKILLTDLRPSWLIFSDGFVKTRLERRLKRAIDVVLAFGVFAACLPLMAVIALAIKLDSRGPVLFRQERVGEQGRRFFINKFRSMRAEAERDSGPVWARTDDPRITRVGRILRRARLDELPQLFNVLAGDMSFVGPRPERPEFVQVLQEEIPFYLARLSVKPGVTGWAQVRHRYAASIEDTVEKLQYDFYYIKNMSPFLDLLVLLSTIQVVVFGRGCR
jgi:sugar transferase (PEP-CTERM system associated)